MFRGKTLIWQLNPIHWKYLWWEVTLMYSALCRGHVTLDSTELKGCQTWLQSRNSTVCSMLNSDSALLTKQKDAVYKLHALLIRCTRPKRNMSNAVTRRVLSHGECILWNGTIFFAKAPLWLSKVQCWFLLKLFLFRIMYRSVKRNGICSSTEVSCNS